MGEMDQIQQIFFQNCPGMIIGVTGTKGKSTTSSLISEILKSTGMKCVLLGNIGRPALDYLGEIDKNTLVIFELSSADDEIILDGDTLTLVMDAAYTAALELGDTPPAWSECVVRITVTRPSGVVEPQYELAVALRPWSEP